MKKTSSLKTLKKRHEGNIVVRRRKSGIMRFFVINKDNPRYKARQ